MTLLYGYGEYEPIAVVVRRRAWSCRACFSEVMEVHFCMRAAKKEVSYGGGI